jgi:hypothetical protein
MEELNKNNNNKIYNVDEIKLKNNSFILLASKRM